MATHPNIKDIYEYLRPYRDSEIPAAMARLANYGMLKDICDYTFPDIPLEDIRRSIVACSTSDEFQAALGFPLLESIITASMSAFTYGGSENGAECACSGRLQGRSCGHLYISNHRDIVLDGALLQYVMRSMGLPTTEITFGSNLISPGFIEDFGRSNKMFKIERGGSGRDLVQNSQILSTHLHEVVDEGRSIWISQRDGRTKDGNDHTDQGLIKMLTMDGSDKSILESLKSLNIIPVAISYEYESCDALKAREIFISRRGPYTKQSGEDLRSILTGIQQYKGLVHLELCDPITAGEIDSLEGENNNEILRNMANIIDHKIISAYKLHKTNYIAYDIRSESRGTNGIGEDGRAGYAGGSNAVSDVWKSVGANGAGEDNRTGGFSDNYSPDERIKFTEYLGRQASSVVDGLVTCGEDKTRVESEIMNILLDIYAYPIINRLASLVSTKKS